MRGARALLALVLSGAASAIGALPREGAWTEVRTRHFVLCGNASEAKVREVGRTLERFQAVLASLTGVRAANVPLETTVFVFADDDALRPYKPLVRGRPAPVGGFFRGGEEANAIALTAAWSADPRPIVYHEYLHHFLANNFPPQPVWLQEGLAEYYATFRCDEKRAFVGRPVESHLALLRGTSPDRIETILDATQESPEYENPALRQRFYAESWALVHFLLHREPARGKELFRYLALRRAGRPRAEAFLEAFGVAEAAMQRELVAYVRGGRFSYREVALGEGFEVPAEETVRRLPREEVLVRLAGLLESEGIERRGEVEEHLAAALARDPCQPGALAVLARLAERDRRLDDARRLLEDAVASDPVDPRLPYALGKVHLALAAHGDARAEVAAARAAFRESLARDPFQPLTHAALGRTYLFETGDVAPGIAELEAAAERLPARPDLLADLAHLYRRAGDARRSAELTASAEEVARSLPAESLQKRLARGLEEVNRLLGTKREEEAVAVLERLAAQQSDEVRGSLLAQAESLRRTASRNAEMRRYNDAIALLNARQLDRALAAFRALAASARDALIAQRSREQADRIERFKAQRPR